MQLAGELSKISLPSLVQLVRDGRLTGEIGLSQGAKTATIHVEQGRITNVESDEGSARPAFLELFLWLTGTFSFTEGKAGNSPGNFPADEPLDKILRDGIAYLEQKKYLDHHRINGQTVLKPVASGRPALDNPLFEKIDGHKTLSQSLLGANLSRRDSIQAIYNLLSGGAAVVVEAVGTHSSNKIDLPDLAMARLKQDNSDLSQSIVDMVIWVDRVKCWMYQSDADLGRIIEEIQSTENDSQIAEPVPESPPFPNDASDPKQGVKPVVDANLRELVAEMQADERNKNANQSLATPARSRLTAAPKKSIFDGFPDQSPEEAL